MYTKVYDNCKIEYVNVQLLLICVENVCVRCYYNCLFIVCIGLNSQVESS